MTFAAFFCLEWMWKSSWIKLGEWSTLQYSLLSVTCFHSPNSFAVFYISHHLHNIFSTALMVFYLLLASLACLTFWKPGRGNISVGEVAASPRPAPEEPCPGHEQELSSPWTQHLLTAPLPQDPIVAAKMGKEDERRDDRYMDRQFQCWFCSVFNPSWGFCSGSHYYPWLEHWGGVPSL